MAVPSNFSRKYFFKISILQHARKTLNSYAATQTLTIQRENKVEKAFLPSKTLSHESSFYSVCVASRLYHETIGKATKEMCLTVELLTKYAKGVGYGRIKKNGGDDGNATIEAAHGDD